MTRRTTRWWLALALAATACGSAGPSPRNQNVGGRANSLGQEEIRRSNLANAYDVVSTLRPRWLQTRGTDSFQRPTEIQVYVDNTRMTNGLAGLRDISSLGITKIEWVNPIDASARWGLDHGQGAIVVTTAVR